MIFKKNILIFLVPLCLVLVTACTSKPQYGGGVFKTLDAGSSWQQKTNVCVLENENRILDRVDVNVLILDPQDHQTLYLGTKRNGLFVSTDRAESWGKLRSLPKGEIHAIAIHPQAKHIIFVSLDNQVFRSIDAGRTWEIVYLEALPKVYVKKISIDSFSPERIYLGLSDGRLIRSEDEAFSWATLNNFKDSIEGVLINAVSPERIYVATAQKGIFRSDNMGLDWISLSDSLSDYNGAKKVSKILFQSFDPEILVASSNYGLLSTNNQGQTWQDHKLLTDYGDLKIISFDVHQSNPQIIYYTVKGRNLVFQSLDGGMNWTPKSVPTKNQLSAIIIDPFNPYLLYLGSNSAEN
ncbi:hypothetical protein K9K85_00645 [Patescibacteria group bacterium]|nr:hypothetical protein [Patescibacteria group bacterium]